MSIKIRKKGRGWEVDLHVQRANGERFRERKRLEGQPYDQAKQWAHERHAYLLDHGKQLVGEDVPTLADFKVRFMREHCIANRQKPSTIEAKESILKTHLLPAMGHLRLDQIDGAEIQKLKALLAEVRPKPAPGERPKGRHPRQRSDKTVNNVLTTLSTMLKCAVDWKVIPSRPSAGLLPKTDPELEFYDFGEWERLVKAAGELDPRILLTVLLGGEGGLRVGEIVALEQSDVDYTQGVVSVVRQEQGAQGPTHPTAAEGAEGHPAPAGAAGALAGRWQAG
jgi:integrase